MAGRRAKINHKPQQKKMQNGLTRDLMTTMMAVLAPAESG
jgi:hypothetical protein